MEISKELKSALIADVENIWSVSLEEETRKALERAFEITIGTHLTQLKELHLCNNCQYHIATCLGARIKFGNGKGNDNVIECDIYKEK